MKTFFKILGAICGLLAIFLVYYFLVTKLFSTASNAGEFGDMFGAATSYFTALTFAGVLYTMYLQREQLKLQSEDLKITRDELKLTRDELVRTADAQEQSQDALKKQAASLRLTAKLNGLNSLLQVELENTALLANLDVGNPKYKRMMNGSGPLSEILREIDRIVWSK